MVKDNIAIHVRNLAKQYSIGGPQEKYYTLRDTIVNSLKAPMKRIHNKATPVEKFWALNGVSFDIEEGEVVGIIGRNGAGKSTLLKILSRITPPTEGCVDLYGRVGSLLEVGTGFHPELTGRENIYLSGSILGMKRREIDAHLDDIVKFSEIEKFIDTPAKRYSSGMYVRLAFAVAAYLEPEILLVDEVLAVGDITFQKKCLGKMSEVAKEGRTVLIVSHNMNVIENLCTRAILIEHGCKSYDNTNVRDVILRYIYKASNDMEWRNPGDLFNNPYFIPQQIYFTNNHGEKMTLPFTNSEDHYINIYGTIKQLDNTLQIGYALYNESHELIYWSFFNDDKEDNWPRASIGLNNFIGHLPKKFLNAGTYHVELIVARYCLDWISQPGVNSPTVTFMIEGGLSDSPYWNVRRPGIIAPLLNWKIETHNNYIFSIESQKNSRMKFFSTNNINGEKSI